VAIFHQQWGDAISLTFPSPTPNMSTVTTPSQPAGQTVSHYRILNKIGGGGIGVVYQAEDLKIGRHVALSGTPGKYASLSLREKSNFLRLSLRSIMVGINLSPESS
jgi:serine/threonine protein kinase